MLRAREAHQPLGLIEQDERGHLYVTDKAAERFQRLTRSTVESLLPIAESLKALLRQQT